VRRTEEIRGNGYKTVENTVNWVTAKESEVRGQEHRQEAQHSSITNATSQWFQYQNILINPKLGD